MKVRDRLRTITGWSLRVSAPDVLLGSWAETLDDGTPARLRSIVLPVGTENGSIGFIAGHLDRAPAMPKQFHSVLHRSRPWSHEESSSPPSKLRGSAHGHAQDHAANSGGVDRGAAAVTVSPPFGIGSGAVAGGVSVTVFTLLHQILIVPIWWMFPIMLVAGAVCGACLAWCYAELVPSPSTSSWVLYIGMFTTMFGLLALASLVLYESVITIEEMLTSSGGNPIPVGETIVLMVVFTIVWAGVLTMVFRGGRHGFAVAAATTAVLMLLLGFNVSTAGLVEIPTTAWLLVVEFFAYIITLGGTYGLAYAALTRLGRPTDNDGYDGLGELPK